MAEVTEEARARVAKLLSDWSWPAPATLEDILALGEEAVPALAEVLTPERLAESHTGEQADLVVYYALELLAEVKTPEAIAVFLNAFRQVSDDIVEGLEDALKRLGPGAVGPLLEVAGDRTVVSGYPRALAGNGAMYEAGRDPSLRPQVRDGLRAILAGYLARPETMTGEDKQAASSVVVDLSELADLEARPLIDAAFEAGWLDTDDDDPFDIPYIDRKGVDELYEKGGHIRDWPPPPFMEDYRKSRRSHLEQEEKQKRLKLLNREPSAPEPVVLDPRLGRNDPCWCGSGKKYKKCHLSQDEKDKVRL